MNTESLEDERIKENELTVCNTSTEYMLAVKNRILMRFIVQSRFCWIISWNPSGIVSRE